MKNKKNIILSIVIVVLVLLTFIFYDITRTIEKIDTIAKEEALKINNGSLKTLVFAYSVKKDENKLILTLYSQSDVPKVVTTYIMKDDKVESITRRKILLHKNTSYCRLDTKW